MCVCVCAVVSLVIKIKKLNRIEPPSTIASRYASVCVCVCDSNSYRQERVCEKVKGSVHVLKSQHRLIGTCTHTHTHTHM